MRVRFRVTGFSLAFICASCSGSVIATHRDAWGNTFASGVPLGALTMLDADVLTMVDASKEAVQWRGARCERTYDVALEQTWRMTTVNTRQGGGSNAGYAGPWLGAPNRWVSRSVACGDTSLVWASGIFGMGSLAHGQ